MVRRYLDEPQTLGQDGALWKADRIWLRMLSCSPVFWGQPVESAIGAVGRTSSECNGQLLSVCSSKFRVV